MTIDLFGHGLRNLPSVDTEFFSHGPDRKRGPGKCRGITEACSEDAPNPHDHSCCCNPCRHEYVDICEGAEGHCCRCIPKGICAVFTPTTPTDACKVKTWRAKPVRSGVRSTYTFLPLGDIILSVGGSTSYLGSCTWRLVSESLGVDQEVAVDHSGDVHCQSPPDFIIENVNIPSYSVDAPPEDCYGTITFEESSLNTIPFVYKWKDVIETSVAECGACVEKCNILCVKRGDDIDYTREDFTWSEDDQKWKPGGLTDHYIEMVEVEGECYLKLGNFALPFTDDLIKIDETMCSTGLDLSATDPYGEDWVRVSCNPCSCWDYICGQCRCACKSLCVMGMEDGVFVDSFSIPWDKDSLTWTNGTFSVAPSKDIYGGCQATVTGYAEPVPVISTCGDSFYVFVQEDVEDQLASGLVNYLYITCQRCTSDGCASGTCLSDCEDVPEKLFAEISPMAWNEMLGCNPAELCFDPITIELGQVYIPTFLNPSGEFRWIGYGIISCKDCLPATRKNFYVTIDIGCDGTVRFSVEGNGAGCAKEFSFAMPCRGSALWDFEFQTDECEMIGCCDEGGFIIRITE